jgi:hypothetical protein
MRGFDLADNQPPAGNVEIASEKNRKYSYSHDGFHYCGNRDPGRHLRSGVVARFLFTISAGGLKCMKKASAKLEVYRWPLEYSLYVSVFVW